MSEKLEVPFLWSSAERTCLRLLQHKNNTRSSLLEIHAFMLRNSLEKNNHLLAKFIAACTSVATHQLARSSDKANGLIRHARQVFDHMPDKDDSFICNTMMNAHLGARQYPECWSLYRDLRRGSGFKSNSYTLFTVVKLCTITLDFWASQQVHNLVVKEGFRGNLFISTALVDMYGKMGRMGCAEEVFDEMPERSQVSWTVLVGGYAKCGDIDSAREIFNQMPEKDTAAFNAMIDAFVKVGDMVSARSLFLEMPERNVVSWTSMVDGYCNKGDLDKAKILFDAMPQKNLVSWNAMIKGYYQNKQPDEALKLFGKLQLEASLEPNKVTIVSVLPAIAESGALGLGNWVHQFVKRKKMDKASNICTALIHMYAKCGEVTKAREVFDSLLTKDTATWNSLIHGLAVNGYGKEALDAFSEMNTKGIKPNEITMTAVLSACNHSGLVEEGKRWFKAMQEFGLDPKIEHYGCMIDLLGRAGCLEEAEMMIENMPYEVNDIILSSFLSACGSARDFEKAERILKKTHGMASWNDANYITLRNLYATDKRWEDVEEVKTMMRSKKAKKEVGCSVIEAGGEVLEFVSGRQDAPSTG